MFPGTETLSMTAMMLQLDNMKSYTVKVDNSVFSQGWVGNERPLGWIVVKAFLHGVGSPASYYIRLSPPEA